MEKLEFCESKKSKYRTFIGKQSKPLKKECGSYDYYKTLREITDNECKIGIKEKYCKPDDGKCRLDLLK